MCHTKSRRCSVCEGLGFGLHGLPWGILMAVVTVLLQRPLSGILLLELCPLVDILPLPYLDSIVWKQIRKTRQVLL